MILSTEQPVRKINVEVAEYTTDTCATNVVPREIPTCIECGKDNPMICRYCPFFPTV